MAVGSTRWIAQRPFLYFSLGVMLGCTIGCTLTLTFTMRQDYGTPYSSTKELPLGLQLLSAPKPTGTYVRRHLQGKTTKPRLDRLMEEELSLRNQDPVPEWFDPNEFVVTRTHEESSGMSYEEDDAGFAVQQEHQLLVAVVLSKCDFLTKLEVIKATWMVDSSNVVFFASSDCNGDNPKLRNINLVHLPELAGEPYPPQKKTFIVLRYLNEHFLDQYSWFMLATDNVYIRAFRLESFLTNRMDAESLVYMGYPAQINFEDMKRFGLSPREIYCVGGPGVVLSRASVRALVPELDSCLDSYVSSNSSVLDQDVELGRCITRRLKIQCTSSVSLDVWSPFFVDTNRETVKASSLWMQRRFTKLFTVYPVYSVDHLLALHYFYKAVEYNETKKRLSFLGHNINLLCREVPERFRPNIAPFHGCQVNYTEDVMLADEVVSHDFVPMDMYQLQSFAYFDGSSIYEDEMVAQRHYLHAYKHQQHELQMALLEVIKVASANHPTALEFKSIVNGYVRHNGLKGNEYIVDARFTEVKNRRKVVHKRVALLQPLSQGYLVQESNNDRDEKVNFIIPLSKVKKRFDEFMKMYEKAFLKTHEHTRLILSVYSEEDIQYISSKVNGYMKKYTDAEFTIVRGKGEFTRSLALDNGMSALEDHELAFFCDVDMQVNSAFVDRCRQNSIRGKMAYYPEVFKQYKMDYVYKFKNKPTGEVPIQRDTGHWAYYAYGMVCIYKSDYKAVGGLDTSFTGWGGEDVEFFERILTNRLEVFRAPDPGLVHRWHSAECDYNDSQRLESCLMSMAESLAERRELARYVLSVDDSSAESRKPCL